MKKNYSLLIKMNYGQGWRFSYLLYVLAIIAVVIGIILSFVGGSKNGDDFDREDKQTVRRAFLFLIVGIALFVWASFQWGREGTW